MAMAPRVLIVDDDPLIRELLQSYLVGEGYEVACASTAEQAEASLADAEQGGPPFDLVLLDIRLPGKDGLTLTRELRVRSEVGIILITGRNDDIDRIVGLECGADDYVIKPPNPRELVSRAKNLIRRVRHARAPAPAAPVRQPLKRFAHWRLDADRRRLVDRDGSETPLTHGEFQLLSVFLRNSGHTLSRDQLMDQIRNREWLPNDRSIDVLVGRLRRKLRDDPAEPELIITIHGAGYLFTAAPSDA
ncbi:response regulator transcription factor [Pseudomonas delhiensis]|nr:response regulator transcription factor [Pseudomonas delhiensis]